MKIIILAIALIMTFHNLTFASSASTAASPTDEQFSNVAKSLSQGAVDVLQGMKRPLESKPKQGQPAKETPEQIAYQESRRKLSYLTTCIAAANSESNAVAKLIKHSKCTIIANYDNLKDAIIEEELLKADSARNSNTDVAKARKFCLYALSNGSNTGPCKVKGRVYWEQAKTATDADTKIRKYMHATLLRQTLNVRTMPIKVYA